VEDVDTAENRLRDIQGRSTKGDAAIAPKGRQNHTIGDIHSEIQTIKDNSN